MTNEPRAVPGRWPVLGHTVSPLRDPLKLFGSLPAHGDVVTLRLGPLPVHVVTTPELAWRVPATDADKFDKGLVFDKMRPLFGDGLATSNGELNRRQRRMVMPAFGRARIEGYAENTMTAPAGELADSWRPGEVVEFDQRMQDLVLTIAGQTLFSTALGDDVLAEIRRSIPANRRFDAAAARLRDVIGETVVAARKEGADHGDLLSTLLAVRDEDTGEGMSDRQVHEEVITILTTGAETTAVALAWFFHELGQHPDVERRFHAEVDDVLGGRPARFEDLPQLGYTHQIVRRPPPLILMRRAREDVELGGVRIAAGSEVAVSQYTLHRDPRWFPDPGRFDPDRWAPGHTAELPKGAYIPFGAGPRLCPGHVFAPTEIGIVAATIGARWRLVPVPGKKVHAQLKATMQPNRLPMTVVPRRT